MLEKISSALGRKDEEPNIVLAIDLCDNEDKNGIKEIVSGLYKRRQVANDCIKVLYEIGERKPELISDYVDDFLGLLKSKNNRMVWGAMTALSKIAPLKPTEILKNIDSVIAAYNEGSVITIDNSISVFAELVKIKPNSTQEIYKLILQHLKTCRPKEVAQHTERAFICINDSNSQEFRQVIYNRMDSLSVSQQKRVDKVLKKIELGKYV